MQEVRRRRQKHDKPKNKKPVDAQKNIADAVTGATVKPYRLLWTVPYILFGLAVAAFLGYRYASFVKLLHENDMWFSEISVS